MVKQTKTFKKGNVTKKALSAILAASMVMTSSSFVMAAPVVEEAPAQVVAADAEEVAVIDDAGTVEDENVGGTVYSLSNLTMSTTEFKLNPANLQGTRTAIANAIKTAKVTQSGTDNSNYILGFDKNNEGVFTTVYEVTVDGEVITFSDLTGNLDNIPVGLGDHTIKVKGKAESGFHFDAVAEIKYKVTAADTIITFADGNTVGSNNTLATQYTYTGQKIEPTITSIVLKDSDVALSGYRVVYSDQINAGTATMTVKFAEAGVADLVIKYTIAPINLNDSNTVVTATVKANQGFVYSGEVQVPELASVSAKVGTSATVAAVSLTPGTDYEVKPTSGYNLKEATDQQFQIEGKGNFTGTYTCDAFKYTIEKDEFNTNTVTVTSKKVAYNKNGAQANVTVKDKKGNTVKGYTVKYFDEDGKEMDPKKYPSSIGVHKIQIVSNGTGNFKAGTIDAEYEIVANSLETYAEQAVLKNVFNKELEKNKDGVYCFEYNREGQIPASVTLGTLVAGADYKLEMPSKDDCVNVGTYTIKVIGLNEFAGQSATISFAIEPFKITSETIANSSKRLVYEANVGRRHDGTLADKATLVITDTAGKESAVLEEGKDYTYTTDKTKGQVVVTGLGNYTTVDGDNKTIALKYDKDNTKMNLNDDSISAVVNGTYTYQGVQVRPEDSDIVVKEGDYTLVKDVDYDVTFGANNGSGEGTVNIIAKAGGKYTGTRVIKFKINGTSFADTFAIAPIADKVYNGTPQAVKFDDLVLVYKSTGATAPRSTVADSNSIKYYRDGKVTTDFISTGIITVEIKGKGNYEGTLQATYKIVGEDISVLATVKDISDQPYTGSAVTPEVKVVAKDTANKNRIFTEGKDYKVTFENNVQAGEALVIVEGIGKYSGKIVKSFNIVGEMDQTIEVLAAQERDLGNGSRTLNSKATKIKYTAKTAVTFESSNPDVVTVDAEGNVKYTGLGEATITIKAAAENGYKEATKELKVVVKLAKPSFTPFSKNNAFTLTSSTVKGAEKFEVQYATKKDFSNKKSVKFTATSGKVRQVKVSAADKTTYYVRVRAISGTETSAWSATKTVATK